MDQVNTFLKAIEEGGEQAAKGGIQNVAVVSVFVLARVTICSFSQLLPSVGSVQGGARVGKQFKEELTWIQSSRLLLSGVEKTR